MAKGYEYTYQTIVPKLAVCDFAEAAARLGLRAPIDGTLKVHFLGREYEITPTGVKALDRLPSDPNDRSILIYYLTSQGFGEPDYSYRMPHYFIPNSLGAGDISWLADALKKEFGNDYQRFSQVLKNLGATLEEPLRPGEYIWHYSILPKMPLKIIYFAADEEFPCEFKIMLDNSAIRFLEFEQLAFLCGCLIRTLAQMGAALK
jgi:hypothetical protein